MENTKIGKSLTGLLMLLRKERWWKDSGVWTRKILIRFSQRSLIKELRDFIISNTKNFFQMLTSPDSFLATWLSDYDYMVVEDIVPLVSRLRTPTSQQCAL